MIYAHKESIFEATIDKILEFLEYMQSVNIRYWKTPVRNKYCQSSGRISG